MPIFVIRIHESIWRTMTAFCAILIGGCGSTISTRVQSTPAQPVRDGILDRAQITRDIRAIHRPNEIRINPRNFNVAIRELVLCAGNNPGRLAEVAKVALRRAEALPASQRQERAGLALAACEIAYQSLRESGLAPSRWLRNQATLKQLAIYNTALAILFFQYSEELARGTATLSVQTPLGPRTVAARYAPESRYQAQYFDKLIPADYVKITGFEKRIQVNGVGVPLVAARQRTAARKTELRFQPPRRGVFVALGSFAKFEPDQKHGSRMHITLFDLDQTSTVRVGGESVPLAGDFTAPLALSLEGINDLMIGVRALLNVGASADVSGIYLTEPFDANRIPVLLIHGLSSSPLVWRNLATDLMANPIIRKNFQFWYAFYSSGMPIPQSAALIREKIGVIRRAKAASAKSRASKNMVVVGYSMGGIIARILVTENGGSILGRPLQEAL